MTDELTFIGTATAVIRLGPFTLLTDPNFLHRGERAYLGYGLWSKRRTEPAMQPSELPPLDAIVLSHMHGDHWDRRAREGLDKGLPIVTTTHAARRLTSRDGFEKAVGLSDWQQHRLEKDDCALTVTSVPGVHSTNTVLQKALPPVMGSMLELDDTDGRTTARVYITGDTMLFDGIREVARRYPDIDAAVVHTGGTTLPGGFVVTMTGADAVQCLQQVRPRIGIPIHYDDYGVFKSGLDDVRRAADVAALDVEMRYVNRGETVSLRSAPARVTMSVSDHK